MDDNRYEMIASIQAFYGAVVTGLPNEAARVLSTLDVSQRELFLPFAEALRYIDEEGERALGYNNPSSASAIVANQSPENLRRAAVLLKGSGGPTRNLFDSPEGALQRVRRAVGVPAEDTNFPGFFFNPATQKPYSPKLQHKLRSSPKYNNSNIRADLLRLRRDNGAYVDLNKNPVQLHQLVQGGRLEIRPLLGGPTKSGEMYELLYALASPKEHMEIRVVIRSRGIFHSSLFGPTFPVLAAGNLYVRDGLLRGADLGSGHFSPDQEKSLKLVKNVLDEMEIPGSRRMILDFEGNTFLQGAIAKVSTGETLLDDGDTQMELGEFHAALLLFEIAEKSFRLENDPEGILSAKIRQLAVRLEENRRCFVERNDFRLGDIEKPQQLERELLELGKQSPNESRILRLLVSALEQQAGVFNIINLSREFAEIQLKIANCFAQLGDPVKQSRALGLAARFFMDEIKTPPGGWPPKVMDEETRLRDIAYYDKILALLDQAMAADPSPKNVGSLQVMKENLLREKRVLVPGE